MSNLAQATAKVVEIISAFSSEERLRIVRASLTLLGDEFNTPPTGQMAQRLSDQRVDEDPKDSLHESPSDVIARRAEAQTIRA